MHQISISGMDEVTAFGFFHINLNQVITVSMLKYNFTVSQMVNNV